MFLVALGLFWNCFVFCLLFVLFYVICAPVPAEAADFRSYSNIVFCFREGGGGGVEGEVEVSAGSFPKSAAGNRDQGPVVRKPINLTL